VQHQADEMKQRIQMHPFEKNSARDRRGGKALAP